jgi:hypothetical protein
VVSANRPDHIKMGTIGLPIDGAKSVSSTGLETALARGQ